MQFSITTGTCTFTHLEPQLFGVAPFVAALGSVYTNRERDR